MQKTPRPLNTSISPKTSLPVPYRHCTRPKTDQWAQINSRSHMKVGGQRWIDGTDARMENEGVETHKEGRVRTTHSALMKPGEELFKRKKAGRQKAGNSPAEGRPIFSSGRRLWRSSDARIHPVRKGGANAKTPFNNGAQNAKRVRASRVERRRSLSRSTRAYLRC